MSTEPQDEREVSEHLRVHLTDGRWHDWCRFCLNRRRRGGTGVPSPTARAGTDEQEA